MPDVTDLGTLNSGHFHVVSIAVVYFGVNVTKGRVLAYFLC
jgi:hypothetical protein